MKITLTQPTMIGGKHHEVGEQFELDDNDALAIVSAGRGTIDPTKAAAAQAEAKKSKKAE